MTASSGAVRAAQNLLPGFTAVGGLEDAALVVVIPQVAGGANENGIAVLWIDQDFGDVLGIFQADAGPVLSAVGRFVDAISDRNAVPHPGFAGADPHRLGIGRINREGADGLHILAIENGAESRAPIYRLPNATAGSADEHRETALVFGGGHSSNASAHGGRADVTGGKAGNGGRIEFYRRLSVNSEARETKEGGEETGTQAIIHL